MYLFIFFFQIFNLFIIPSLTSEEVFYPFTSDPIDVVIPSIEKDAMTLELCIAGIRKNCSSIRKVIVVSSKQLTHKAEWFDESRYPFSKKDVAFYLSKGVSQRTSSLLQQQDSRLGWYYQQLLKLYAPFVIPDISPNV